MKEEPSGRLRLWPTYLLTYLWKTIRICTCLCNKDVPVYKVWIKGERRSLELTLTQIVLCRLSSYQEYSHDWRSSRFGRNNKIKYLDSSYDGRHYYPTKIRRIKETGAKYYYVNLETAILYRVKTLQNRISSMEDLALDTSKLFIGEYYLFCFFHRLYKKYKKYKKFFSHNWIQNKISVSL